MTFNVSFNCVCQGGVIVVNGGMEGTGNALCVTQVDVSLFSVAQ